PKYLNSAESPVFRKGHMLYGLALARDAIRKADRAVVVEGYLDVIALAQAGIGEVVAPLGTALTVEQLRLVRRFTEQVIACFDGDLAGRRAAARSFPVFLEAGLWGRGAFLPAAEDPDTFVRAQGRAALEGLLAAAEPLVEAFVGELAGAKRDAVGRHAEAAREVARLLKRVREPHEFDVLARLAAERLGVREDTLRSEGAPGTAPAAAPDEPHALDAEATLVELMAEDAALAERVVACGIIAEFHTPSGAAPPRRSRSAKRRSARPAWRRCRATFESAWCAACSRSDRTWNASGRSPTASPAFADEARAAKSAACAMRFAPPRRAEIRKPWKPPCAA